MTAPPLPHSLISTDEVAAALPDPPFTLLEVDEDTGAWAGGHLPGAVPLDWREELQDPLCRGVLTREAFERLLGAKGITESTPLVLYGGNNNWFAAYGYWYLRYYGHDDVRLMDGGRKKWELEGRPLTTDPTVITPAHYHAKPPREDIRALRDDVIAKIGRVPMVDVRSPEEYSGLLAAPPHLPQEQAQRNGHIPGATNVPWSRAAREDGSFRGIDELREIYLERAGLSPEVETIAYCRIGERSSHTWFVLHELLGFPAAKNYDGSWTEYGSLVGMPVEREAPAAR